MARVSTYLNFNGDTEQAFLFYRAVFGGDFNGPIHRFKEIPAVPCPRPPGGPGVRPGPPPPASRRCPQMPRIW